MLKIMQSITPCQLSEFRVFTSLTQLQSSASTCSSLNFHLACMSCVYILYSFKQPNSRCCRQSATAFKFDWKGQTTDD